MSDNDNDNEKSDGFDTDEDGEESLSSLPKGNSRTRRVNRFSDLRQPRQKYNPQWEIDFPWLKPDKIEESTGFCNVCKNRLVCSNNSLKDHQNSIKHLRLSGLDVPDSRSESNAEPSSESVDCLNFSSLPRAKTGCVNRKKISDLRYPRQKYNPRWEIDYPWLRPDKIEESTGFCNFCKNRLVCSNSSLKDHQNTIKHLRLSGTEVPDPRSESNVESSESLDCGNFSSLPRAKTSRVNRKKLAHLRHPRKKYNPQWEIDFPWLKPDKIEESTGFCNICKNRLVCSISSLKHHQNTTKHLRLSGIEVPDPQSESNEESESLDCGNFSSLPRAKTSSVNRKKVSDLRHPRQKYCPQWENDFPWLQPDKIDESTGFCNVCKTRLVCKKSHLEQHQGTFKHLRLSGLEVPDSRSKSKAEPSEFLECGNHESDDEEELEENAIGIDPDYSVELEMDLKSKQSTPARNAKKLKTTPVNSKPHKAMTASASLSSTKITSSTSKPKNVPVAKKLDRFKLLKRIDRDRHELNAFYGRRQEPPAPAIVQQPSRDSFDLFFESVSASVKTLPPKMATEVKSRFSQIIAEFELRAICEREALEVAAVAVASSTNDVGASAVPHIVYTFQPKLPE